MSPQAAILGGPVADTRSWLASGRNLAATAETLVLGGCVSPQTPAWFVWLWLRAFPVEMSRGNGRQIESGQQEARKGLGS